MSFLPVLPKQCDPAHLVPHPFPRLSAAASLQQQGILFGFRMTDVGKDRQFNRLKF
ncbi:hypothetical protein GX408_14625 [bacterium]|nr:hypothetical protein [bacterium]